MAGKVVGIIATAAGTGLVPGWNARCPRLRH